MARARRAVMQLRGERVVLRPMTEGDVARLREIHATPAVARWWGKPEAGFPLSDEPEATRLTIMVDQAIAGLIQFSEETEPRYRHARIDVFLASELHGQGFGTDAVRTLATHLIAERGHHRITIDPAADNGAAIRSYEKVGFRPVGVMRCAERAPDGSWRDILLMELVRPPVA